MRAIRFAALAIGVGLLISVGTIFATVKISPPPKTLEATQPSKFDHSRCQYPDRTTNPANGCDNSDPCDPAQVKGGSGDCLPTNSEPVVTEPIIEMEGK